MKYKLDPPSRQMQDLEDAVGLNEHVESHLLANQRVQMITMGCGHNMADSNTILSKMVNNGAQIVNDDGENTATIVYVNSCTVKTPSAQKALNEVLDALGKGKKVIMGGCVPQAGESFMPKLTEYIRSGQLIVNGVLDDQKLDQTIKRLGGQDNQQVFNLQQKASIKAGKPIDESLIARKAVHNPSVLPVYRQQKFVDVVPISQGCMGSCTYCKTVQARGRLVSYPIEQVVERIKAAAVNKEIKEIWITGEDTLAWGLDQGTDFYPVMQQIVQHMGDHQMLRIGMADPESLIGCEEKLAEILKDKKVYKFLHLPLQSASDSVLQQMKRRYTYSQYEECIKKMLDLVPELVIETDIIVGFPGETDEDFQKTIQYFETMKPEIVNITQYYQRPNTLAASMPQINPQVKKQRSKIASEVSTRNYNREKYIGRVFDCIICETLPFQEGKFKNNRIFGAKTPSYLSILLEFPDIQSGDKDQMIQETGLKVGDSVTVEVIQCSRVALIGKVLTKKQ